MKKLKSKSLEYFPMILLVAALVAIFAPPLVLTGCKGTPHKQAVNTLFTLQATTVAAYDGYIGEVIAGRVKTNGLPTVSRKFNQFQASTLVALDAVEWNTNALAPNSLLLLSGDLLNLIATFSKK